MLLLHLHPKAVPEEALVFRRTFGLGGIAVVLFLLLAVSGALLLFGYEPSPERAYGSVREIVDQTPFGAFIRNAHHWAANGLLLVALLHLLRVLFSGAYDPPRRANWIVGLALLLLVMASNFTGYLLPWDQLAYWAVTIATGMLEYVPLVGGSLLRAARGGAEVGSKTLALFFVLHVAILPIALFVLTSFHFWLVRKAGGVILPREAGASRRTMVPTSPHLVAREGPVALVTVATVLVVAALVEAPLLAQANPGMSPNPAKAPWYFMGFQELLLHLHPAFAVLVVPLLLAGLLVALPYLRHGEAPSGAYFQSPAGGRSALSATVLALVAVPAWVLVEESARRTPPWLPFLPQAVRAGLIPVLLICTVHAGVYLLARRLFGASRLEALQAVVTFVVVALVVLTVTGSLFRGQGMALTWPWALAGSR
ncbi:MAG: cytochrome b N-terminal domain-containing protein [Thermoanaerobaculaceae bacterium]|jgi:quinol-cytochrome oxidoreductase complex cytochrome b subunit|nr:cytochrome b N-terminal domain-containing protein [Thermoanaerobaculaceae bacterium]